MYSIMHTPRLNMLSTRCKGSGTTSMWVPERGRCARLLLSVGRLRTHQIAPNDALATLHSGASARPRKASPKDGLGLYPKHVLLNAQMTFLGLYTDIERPRLYRPLAGPSACRGRRLTRRKRVGRQLGPRGYCSPRTAPPEADGSPLLTQICH